MVNIWKEYKITGRTNNSDFIRFDLSDWVSYDGDNKRHIDCTDTAHIFLIEMKAIKLR